MSPEAQYGKVNPNDGARTRRLLSITRHYSGYYRSLEDEGAGPYRLTSLGAWAASRAPHVYYFFKRMELGQRRLFCDLGSGDGIVTLVASLFTSSVGIEIDHALCSTATRTAELLGLESNASFVCADYLTQNIRSCDCLYVYPDKPFHKIEELLHGWNGILLIYGPHMPPKHMLPAARLACGKERLVVYRASSLQTLS